MCLYSVCSHEGCRSSCRAQGCQMSAHRRPTNPHRGRLLLRACVRESCPDWCCAGRRGGRVSPVGEPAEERRERSCKAPAAYRRPAWLRVASGVVVNWLLPSRSRGREAVPRRRRTGEKTFDLGYQEWGAGARFPGAAGPPVRSGSLPPAYPKATSERATEAKSWKLMVRLGGLEPPTKSLGSGSG
jgi:hypothetical protein